MSEQNNENETVTNTESPTVEASSEEVSSSEFVTPDETHPEVVEISWEEVEKTLQLRQLYSQSENTFAQLLVEFERKKQALWTRMNQIESAVYDNARDLREAKELNPDWTYELKLPEKQGEKGYFVRKEE